MASLIQTLSGSLLNLLARLSLGENVANVLTVVQMIVEAIQKDDLQEISQYVFDKLPAAWKDPLGPTTEAALLDMIQSGEDFIKKVFAMTVKQVK